MKTEHIYTCRGTQRAIFNLAAYGDAVKFSLETPYGARCTVEVTDDPVEVVRAGKATWHPVVGTEGYLVGTCMRLNVHEIEGWAKITVEGVNGPDFVCVGLLTRNNAILATVARDMRVCAIAA